MRRSLALTALGVLLGGVAGTGTAAATALSTEFSTIANREVRPSRVQVGNISYLSGLRWSRWGTYSASGRGTLNSCNGSGACRPIRVRVTASKRGYCASGYLFERLQIRAVSPSSVSARAGLPISHSWRSQCGHGPLLP